LEVDGGAVEEDLATFELASTLCRDLAGAERGDSLPVAVEPLGEVEEAVAIGCRGNLVNAALLVVEDWVASLSTFSLRFLWTSRHWSGNSV
jgi:hypothetical protein